MEKKERDALTREVKRLESAIERKRRSRHLSDPDTKEALARNIAVRFRRLAEIYDLLGGKNA